MESLPEVARWLHQQFRQPPEDFQAGRDALRSALSGQLSCTEDEAEALLDDLERGGYIRYAAEGRSIGGTPGQWMVYPTPADEI